MTKWQIRQDTAGDSGKKKEEKWNKKITNICLHISTADRLC